MVDVLTSGDVAAIKSWLVTILDGTNTATITRMVESSMSGAYVRSTPTVVATGVKIHVQDRDAEEIRLEVAEGNKAIIGHHVGILEFGANVKEADIVTVAAGVHIGVYELTGVMKQFPTHVEVVMQKKGES